jgi:hypothetical protein
MTYTHVDQTPSRYQWDDSSRFPLPDPGNAPANCGPTGVTFIANFFRDANFGINATRTLSGAPNYVGTSISQQRTMLQRRGVGCYASQPSVLQMRSLVASGRRPIMVGLYMARVPSSVRGHPFTGMHTVVLRRTRTVNGVRGFDVLDPNFSKRTGRTDPTNGHRFYSESVVNWAFYEATIGSRSWALIPSIEKAVTAPAPSPTSPTTTTAGGLPVSFTSRYGWKATIKAGKPRRSGASVASSNFGNTDSNGEVLPIWGEVVGEDMGKYGLSGGKRWLFGPQYIGGRWRVVYIPLVDLTNRSF